MSTGSPAAFRWGRRRGSFRANEAGFTLIEVLVAVAITAILLVPLIRNFASNINYSATADATIEATLIAESMIETLGARLPLSPGESVAGEGRFSVAASVQPYVGENGPPAGRYVVPYELAVSVSWQEGRRRRAVALRTVRLAAAGRQ